MARRTRPSANGGDKDLDLDGFRRPPEEQGLALDELSAAFSQLLEQGRDPYDPDDQAGSAEAEAAGTLEPFSDASVPADAACPVTPRSILEALLFVGNPHNEPLTSAHVSSLMRGVRPQEIDSLVVELNEQYDAEGCPYRIGSAGSGYQLALREEYASLRDKFYGRVKEARLSPAAVEVLAIVAYRQPLTRDEIDALRGRPSGGVLAQLVRRQLLRIERPADRPRQPKYLTTDRFLTLFGLESLAELPQSQDLDRAL